MIELQRITKKYEAALNTIGWKPDHMNYAMLGNFFHEHAGHEHLHIIPRYAPRDAPIRFMNVLFKDDRWGKNYAPETPMHISERALLGIVSALKNAK